MCDQGSTVRSRGPDRPTEGRCGRDSDRREDRKRPEGSPLLTWFQHPWHRPVQNPLGQVTESKAIADPRFPFPATQWIRTNPHRTESAEIGWISIHPWLVSNT